MPTERKVIFLTDSLMNGGAERQLALLIKYLPNDWKSRVWSMCEGPYADIIRKLGVDVIVRARASRFDVSPSFSLWKLLASYEPDIVHSWGWMSTLAAAPICKLKKIPLVNGTVRKGRRPLERHLGYALGIKWSNLVIANSEAGLEAWGLRPDKGRVVHNGFDPDRFSLCEKTNRRPDAFTVVMTGRMVDDKDYKTFFAAARDVIRSNTKKWHFIAIGDGPNRETLMQQNRDLVEQGVLDFPKVATEALGIVSQANIGVLMSDPMLAAEGCSNSIMEYMACGLPVICNEGGGNRELVEDGKTGFIIRPYDQEELADKLLWAQMHSKAADAMGARGRDKIEREFNVSSLVSKTISVYAEVMALRHA